VVAVEASLPVQAHRTQGGTDRPSWRPERGPRSYEQHLSVPKDARL
jgi:hypothetical protein